MATNTKQEEATQEAPAKGKKRPLQGEDDVFYIVNPAGAVHTVARAHCKARLRQVGFRLATDDEIKTYLGQRVQHHKTPIAQPWNPEPEVDVALPDEA